MILAERPTWKWTATTLGLVLNLTAAFVNAEVSGLTLLELCKPPKSDFVVELTKRSECRGFIRGIIDSNLYWKTIYGIDSWCFAPLERAESAHRAAVAWLEANPNELHLPAVILLNRAFSETFPCEN